jgi:hypothetical protein
MVDRSLTRRMLYAGQVSSAISPRGKRYIYRRHIFFDFKGSHYLSNATQGKHWEKRWYRGRYLLNWVAASRGDLMLDSQTLMMNRTNTADSNRSQSRWKLTDPSRLIRRVGGRLKSHLLKIASSLHKSKSPRLASSFISRHISGYRRYIRRSFTSPGSSNNSNSIWLWTQLQFLV